MASNVPPAPPPSPPQPATPPTGHDPGSNTPPPEVGPVSWRESARTMRFAAWLKRFAKLWGFALFVLFVVYIFRNIALPFVFAMLVAYLLAPAVDRMAKFRLGASTLPRGAAVIMLYVVMLSALAGSFSFIIPRLSGDFARLFREAPELFTRFERDTLPKVGAWIDEHLGAGDGDGAPAEAADLPALVNDDTILEPLPDGRYKLNLQNLAFEVKPGTGQGELVIVPYSQRKATENAPSGGRWERSIKKWVHDRFKGTQDETQRAIEYGQRFVTATITGIWKLILVLMLAAFMLVDLERVRGFIRSLVPDNYRSDYDRIARGIDRGLSGVIRGQLMICLLNGIFTYVGLLIFHVKYPLLLAGIAAVMSLIPIFGSFLSSLPIVVIALVSKGGFDVMMGLYVTGWIVLIHLIEANFLNPKILGNAARTHPVLVVFALVAGEYTYGLTGALFAVPVLSIVQTIFVYMRRRDLMRAAESRAAGVPSAT